MTTRARIFRPDKNAMQSGKRGMQEWILEILPREGYFIEPLMGWTGMREMTRELGNRLTFPTREAAIAYAEREKIQYEVIEPKRRSQVKKSYADNFKYQA